MKNVSWFKTQDAYVAAFLMPVLIMILIFIQRGIVPFGDESFLRMDMYHQYAPFFSEFKYKLSHGGSLLYSWHLGLGINFAALYSYYLASPLNWLIILVPQKFVLEFMAYMIVFKIGLSGLSFAYYLRKHSKFESFGIAFFAIFYALSGYMAAYNWNIMWLDCIVLFPLIMLGLESLVYERKFILYTLSLAMSISSNYYISIMICLFLVFYFFSLLIIKPVNGFKDLFISGIQFAVFSILAAVISLVILLPEIYALMSTASGEFNFPKSYSEYFSIIDILARHMPNIETHTGLDHWPNIYCGVAVYIFAILYLINDKIRLRERAVYAVLCIFLFAGFSINVLNYIWHGLHYPNSLPARQSFIYIFIVLYMSYKAYENMYKTSTKRIGTAVLTSIAFILIAQKTVTEGNIHFIVYYISMILIGVYGLLLYVYKKGKLNINILLFVVLGVVSVEAAINTTVTSASTVNKTEYTRDNASIRLLLSGIDTKLYRVDKTERKTKDDGAWLNFNSVSLFSSVADASLTDFIKKLGAEASTNAYSITGATPLFDMLTSVKYALYNGESNNKNLKLINSDKDTYLYENPYALPIGYVISRDIEDNWVRDLNNPAEVQNDLSNLLGLKAVMEKVDGKLEGSSYTFRADREGLYYIYVTNPNVEDAIVSRLDSNKTYENLNRRYLIELYDVKAGEEISISSDTDDENIEASVYRFDYEALKGIYDIFSKEPMEITSYGDDHINANVTLSQNGVLMTSIPYDKGWTVTVDGVKVATRRGFDSFLAVDMQAGTHTVSFKYVPQGLIYGALGTCGGLILLVMIFLSLKFIKKKKYKKAEILKEDQDEEADPEIEESLYSIEEKLSQKEGMTGEKESRIKEQHLSKVSSLEKSEEKMHGTDVMAGEKEIRIKEQHLSKVSSFERSEEKIHGTEGIVREGKRAIDQNNNEVGSVKSDHPKSADSTEDNR
jgi:hypothetical protein